MEPFPHIERLLLSSRRVLALAVLLVLAVLAGVVLLTTLLIRHSIREQIVGRDGEVLYAVALMYYAEDVAEGLAGPITDPGSQLSIVLRSAQIRGVLGVRLFDPEGRFVESFPPPVREGELDPALRPRLRALRPACVFHPDLSLATLFYPESSDAGLRSTAVLEVNVPLHTANGPLAGVAQFLVEGQSIGAEFAQLDRHLLFQASMATLAGSVLLGVTAACGFGRLKHAHRLVAKRTRDLVQANQELALAAKTSALGAVTAHLIHGLRNPLAGLHNYVASRRTAGGPASEDPEWLQAVATSRRMQTMIRQVVGVLRNQSSAMAYEISPGEFAELLRSRIEPLAREKGVRLETAVQARTPLPNRTADLLTLILVNLAENAIEATPLGKTVRLVIQQAGQSLRFEVQDQGSGFPAGLPLFMPCVSTKEGGSGIGLALCKHLASHLGADLELAASSTAGCVFQLTLPLPGAGVNGLATDSRLSVALLAALLACVSWSAQAVDFPLRWRWSNPAPHGGNVVDMAYSPALALGIQVAERGQIFTTADLDLWLPRDSGVTASLRAVTFFGSRIVITGESGAVLYADDVSNFRPGSIVDGPTANWLEAVTASPRLAVAAGDDGYLCTSTDGVTWKKQDSGTNTWFRGAAYGNGVFVVVGDDGEIRTSSDGTNWVRRTSPTGSHLNRVHYGGGRFTAVGDRGVTASSTNGGVTWFLEFPGATNTLHYATAGGSDRLVDGTSEVRLQAGSVWSNQIAQPNGPPDWTYYTALGLPGFFLVAGRTGLQSEGYLASGPAYGWITPYNSVRSWMWDVVRLPGFYAAVGDLGTILTSGNGVDWTLELVPGSVTNTTFLGIGGTTNLLLAVGDSGTMVYSPNIVTNIIITNATGVVTQTLSSLGVVWFPMVSPTVNDLQAVGVLSNSLYVVAGAKGVIYTSPTGTNAWTLRDSGTSDLLTSVAEWPGGLIAVGDNGTLLSSADGVSWTKINLGTTNWLYRARWLNQTLLVVGAKGTLLTSTNGTAWTSRFSGTTQWLNDAACVGDTWFVVGTAGTVLTSSNLTAWANRGTITKKALYSAATDGKQLALVGVEGVILRAQVIPEQSPVNVLDYSHVTSTNPPAAFDIFLFGGKPDQRFDLSRTTNLTDAAWSASTDLEIFDGSGTLYYIESVPTTNQLPAEYYRTQLQFQ